MPAQSTVPPGTSASVTPPPPPQSSSVSGSNVNTSSSNIASNSRLARMEDKVLVTRTADEETEDGRIRNREAMAKIRDAWVYKQVRARVAEFTDYKQVRFRTAVLKIPCFSFLEYILSFWNAYCPCLSRNTHRLFHLSLSLNTKNNNLRCSLSYL